MKKKVKALIIAASVAAIAGIGAVSFASWTATDTRETTGNSLGHVNIAGLGEVTTKVTDLLPYDQTETYATQIQTVALTVEGATGAYNVKVEVDNWNDALATGSVLYVVVDENSTAPTIDTENPITGWNDAASYTTTANFEKTVTTVYAHFALKSDDSADMDKTFDITYTLIPVEEAAD